MSAPSGISSLEEFPPLGTAAPPSAGKKKRTPHASPAKSKSRQQAPGGGARGKSKWQAPATPVFHEQSNVSVVSGVDDEDEGETPRKTVPNPMLAPDSVKSSPAARPADAPDAITSSPLLPAIASQDVSTVQDEPEVDATSTDVAASASATGDVNGSPVKSPVALPGRRLSAFLQERVDVFEKHAAENSADPSPHGTPYMRGVRSSVHSAEASPAMRGIIAPGADLSLSDQLLSPIVAVHTQPLIEAHSALHADPTAAEVDWQRGEFVEGQDDPDIAAAYFQDGGPPTEVDFGTIPPEEEAEAEDGESSYVFRSPDQSVLMGDAIDSQPRGSLVGRPSGAFETSGTHAESGSILAALSQPAFLHSDDGDYIDHNDGNTSRRASAMNASYASPNASSGSITRHTTASATPVSGQNSPAPAASAAQPVAGTPAPAGPAADDVASPSAYFGARSAPLGSLSGSKYRPTFGTPEFVNGASPGPPIFSPVNVATAIYQPTPPDSVTKPASRLTTPRTTTTPGTVASAASAGRASTSASKSASRIPVRASAKASPEKTPKMPSSAASSAAKSITSSAARSSIAPPSQTRPSVTSHTLHPPLPSTGGASVRLSFSSPAPSPGVTSATGGVARPSGLFGASPSPIARASPSTGGQFLTSTTATSDRLRTPLTPHDVATLAHSRSQPPSPYVPASFNLTGVSSGSIATSATTVLLPTTRTPSTILASPARASFGGTVGGVVETLHEEVSLSSSIGAAPSLYPLTILVSTRLHALHRFVLFEVEAGMESVLRSAAETYVHQAYPGESASTSAPELLLRHLHPHPGGRSAWTLTCILDVSTNDSASQGVLRRDAWCHAFLTNVATKCCKKAATGAVATGTARPPPHFAVRFVEERPIAWHQKIRRALH